VGDGAFPLIAVSDTVYETSLKGYQIHRGTAIPVYVIMWDTVSTGLYGVVPTMDVVGLNTEYFPRPLTWWRDILRSEWDTGYTPLPKIYRIRELKELINCDLKTGYVALREMETGEDDRGRGDYVDLHHNMEIIVEIQGPTKKGAVTDKGATEQRYEKMVAEVRRIFGIYKRWIPKAAFDFWTPGGFRDESDEYSGRFRFVWRITNQAPLRGLTLTPATIP